MLDDSKAARGDAETVGAEKPAPPFGYCYECGTWDQHEAICATCGVDFRSHAEVGQIG